MAGRPFYFTGRSSRPARRLAPFLQRGPANFFTHMGQHHGRYRNRIGITHVNQANANTSFVCVMRFDRYELFDAAGVGDLRVAVLVRRSRPYAALGLVQCLRKRHKP